METVRKRMPAGERENVLIEKAIEVLANSNYRSATTARIASEAGVSEPVIYQHFGSKKDLFLAVLERIRTDILEGWARAISDAKSPKTALRILGAHHYMFIKENKAAEKILFQAISEVDDAEIRACLKDHFAAFAGFMSNIVRQGKEMGVINPDLDDNMAGWIIMSFGIGTGFMSLFGFEEETERDRLNSAYELLLSTLDK